MKRNLATLRVGLAFQVLGSVLAACDSQSGSRDGFGEREADGETVPRAEAVVFLGTSLTAGLGVDPARAYPALIQNKLDSAGLDLKVTNAGVSGETSAGGLRRIDWVLREPTAVLVIELGANDALRGQDIEQMKENIQAIIDRARDRYPGVRIALAEMMAPPNLGPEYTSEFNRAFRDLAYSNQVRLMPFLLDGVAGNPELNQADGIHPTAAGHRVMADNVWRALEPLFEEVAGSD